MCSACFMLRPRKVTRERTRTRRKRNVERKGSGVQQEQWEHLEAGAALEFGSVFLLALDFRSHSG